MKGRKLFIIFLLVFTILLSSFSFYAYQVVYAPNVLVEKESRILIIDSDETFKSLQSKLYEDDFVQDIVAFSLLAKIMDYDQYIKPGRYKLKANMSNIDAIRMLRAGLQEPVNLTFNNIRLKDEIAEKITKNIELTPYEFNRSLNKFIADNQEGFNEKNIVSMFIPNTYHVYYDISGDELVERMHYEYRQFWSEERKRKADSIGLTPLEVSTLASIVQAESIKRDEGKKIAGLYMNRLKKGIALQADPTLVFASGDFTIKRVLNVHKEIDSPYNTYKYPGLPPGPINMPFIHSIDAVLNYEDHNYFYMCAREDFSGYHNFASTLSEHLNNAARYQRQLTIEQRKARMNNK
ncbi:protein YceG [Fulvivirga imtechensis AK7]|uniref:Endolytic murein transglycosylase n=1 Tax=Fulvivirga imtechensis AK7 TaxID=1237149 RepID=L8JMN5_9BACT|nr:endolytic transglycosylase MltG [Fulvivirga imtechensis]ELR70186.1 protein YceG [Fulvivirga imtechensis AK7]